MKKGIYLYCGIRKQRWRVLGPVHSAEEHIVAGLDLGTSKVAAVIAAVGGQGVCRIMGVGTGSHNGLRRGVIDDQESVTKAVTEAVIKAERMAMMPMPQPLVGIPGVYSSSFAATGSITIARSNHKVQAEDVDRVLEAAKATVVPPGRRIIHHAVRGFAVDGNPIEGEPLGLVARRLEVDVQFMTAALPALESYLQCMNQAGVKAKEVMMQCLAAADLALTPSQRAVGAVLVDLGAGLTDLALFRDSQLQHMGCLPVGTENLTHDLTVGLHVPRCEAERLVRELGYNPAPERQGAGGKAPEGSWEMLDDYNGIFKARAEEIWQLIRTGVANAGAGRSWPAGIKLVGGGALIPGFADLGASIMGLPVEVVLPVDVAGLPEAWQSPSSAVGVGLVLHQADGLAKSAGYPRKPRTVDVSWQKVRTWLRF